MKPRLEPGYHVASHLRRRAGTHPELVDWSRCFDHTIFDWKDVGLGVLEFSLSVAVYSIVALRRRKKKMHSDLESTTTSITESARHSTA